MSHCLSLIVWSYAGLDAELLDESVSGTMSGSNEKHALFFYVNRHRLANGVRMVDAAWKDMATMAASLRHLLARDPEKTKKCIARVLHTESGTARSSFVTELCTLSLLGHTILDPARQYDSV